MNRALLIQQYQQRREIARANRTLDLAWRLVVLVIGGSVLALGLFFIVFPGPGWATIILGLIVLGTEFQWALRLLEPLQNAYRKALNSAKQSTRTESQMVVQFLLTITFVVLAYAYVARFGFSIHPVTALAERFTG